MNRKRSILLIGLIVCMFGIAIIPQPIQEKQPTKGTQFIIAGWSYPDAFGQGIEGLVFLENSTGSWVTVKNEHESQFVSYKPWNETHSYEYNYTFLKIECWTYFNSSKVEVSTTAQGQLRQRHYIEVSLRGDIVFSQQNFTYGTVSTSNDPLWWYCYTVVINYAFFFGETYTIDIDYEVAYLYETES